MTLFLSLVAVVLPVLTSWLISLVKRIPGIAQLTASRTPWVRFVAAMVSLIIVIATEYLSGTFDASIIASTLQTAALAGALWIASMGFWHASRPSTPSV